MKRQISPAVTAAVLVLVILAAVGYGWMVFNREAPLRSQLGGKRSLTNAGKPGVGLPSQRGGDIP